MNGKGDMTVKRSGDVYGWAESDKYQRCPPNEQGRFPANLLVSDDVLNDGYSRFFTLDEWAQTLPFLIVPKAAKSEKGTDNKHPTVKPLKLMSYLITLFSRPGDTVLDPFVGSGTTCLAAQKLDRTSIGIEREAEYAVIAEARLEVEQPQLELEAA
jgi:site-specific DNA-methyltransferase (adenine-specific)